MMPSAEEDEDLQDAGAASIAVPADAKGERLDRFLALRLPALSRTRIKDVVEAGGASIDGRIVTDAGRKLKGGEALVLRLPPAEEAVPLPEDIPLSVAYEDDHLIVIDKPAGLVVHPAGGHPTGTLVNALLFHCGDSLSGIGGVKRPGIVHRLDKDTSGLLVVAKNDRAHHALQKQFADHGRTGPLHRLYRAFAWGVPQPATFTVDAALDRSHINRERMAVVAPGKGRFAITHVATEARFAGNDGAAVASLLACRLETGRTHQIRAHLAHKAHPLMGDTLYGAGFRTKAALLGVQAQAALAALGRQALHAAELGFEHPATGEEMSFSSPLPDDLADLQAALTGS
jgi:23S rRNA pseudouridine1911/1915/1917 synthase